MNRLTHSQNTTILPVLSALTLGCFALAPQARAVCQEGCLTNQNTVLGDDALINNTTGYSNTASGSQALKNNTTGVYNTANGYQALLFNTTGASNTANGAQALFLNTTGSDNTASGVSALSGNTTGNNNTASGVGALAFNTTGGQNTANGVSALLSNMTGSYNTANGYGALNLNTAGNSNTANGNRALASNTDGAYNTANGDSALFNNTTGNDNIALGANAGQNLTTGSNNIDIGNLGVAGESGAIRIGTAGTQTATYVAGIYQAAIGSGLAIRVSSSGKLGTMASSARYKEAIKPMDKASEAILALKPVTFRYKHELDPEGTPQFGLVAEDVEKVNPDLVARDDQGKAYTVRYEAVNAMLLNEFLKEHQTVQELKSTLAKQKATVARQQKQIEALTAGLQKVSAQVEMSQTEPQVVNNTAKVAAPSQSRQLFFEDRVAYQRLIEEVYWRHRIWPKERPDAKPSLDALMSQATIEKKVEDYLRDSELLEHSWQKPITAEQLQAEMDRMARHSKQPEVLRELFAALGNDPFVIAECLARPVLSERLQFATVEWRKEPLESSSFRAQDQMPNVMAAANVTYTLPVISDQPSRCINDSWTATSTTNAPDGRVSHTTVWTGSEMIVWGGYFFEGTDHYLNTGARYNPGTDSWMATSTTNAPIGRRYHTAVWTGSEMIVWGGTDISFTGFNTGGRYNPGTDSWTATSTTNAPTGRYLHTAVLASSEMIVWGGGDFSNLFNTGGRYNPSTDSWTATTTSNAPLARSRHTAVWTGSEMIVWGGSIPNFLNTGGKYNPSTNSWTATSLTGAPDARMDHTAVLTSSSEMIVWGGFGSSGYLNTGGRYNPSTNSWTATGTTNAPTGRSFHTAVLTSSEMSVWGGIGSGSVYLNTGGRYNPGTDSWTASSTTNAPTGRSAHTAVWTGSEMIVWGGYAFPDYLNTGGRYCAQAGGPITLSAAKRKVGGINTVRLTWSGATSTDIDVYRDAVLIVTTANHGSYVDSAGDTGRARYTYQVCEAGTQTCSNDESVKFPH